MRRDDHVHVAATTGSAGCRGFPFMMKRLTAMLDQMIRAGLPATMLPGGTSFATTDRKHASVSSRVL
jgi:hypothetical protein